MRDHSWCEIVGFWLMAGGATLTIALAWMLGREKEQGQTIDWVEQKLCIHPIIFICLPIFGVLAILIGLHMMFVGGGALYPGYPLDIIFEWMKGE